MAVMPLRARRALIAGLSALVAATGVQLALATPAAAAVTSPLFNVVDRPAGAVTADALPTVQIDGVAWTTKIVGDTVYAGGQFANARPAGAAVGQNQTPRNNLLSFNLRTGALNTAWNPNVDGRIRAMTLSPDKSRLYIAGAFLTVGGVTRNHVAAFDTATGNLISSFAPNAGSDVFSIVATDTVVYLGGWFGSVNGVTRNGVAAVSASTGATTGWAPTTNSTINSMTLSPDKSRVIIGGLFSTVNGSFAPGIASLDAVTGASYPFAANATVQNYGGSSGAYYVTSDATNVYATYWWYGGTGNFEGTVVLDPYTGAIKSMVDCHGDSYTATQMNNVLYVGSHYHYCSSIGSFPDTDPRNRWQHTNAFTLEATGTVQHNGQGGYYDFYGQPAPSTVSWFPDEAIGTYTGQYQAVWSNSSTSEYLVDGGEFPAVNGTNQQGLVRYAIPSIAPKKQGPTVSAANSAPTLRGISGGSVRVAWPANVDRDDQKLTYKLYRSDKPTTPIYTTTAVSQFWNRPTLAYLDNGLTANTAYGYWVVVSDPDGNSGKSTTTTITTGTNVIDQSAYAQAVTADGAAHYWRLDEAAGSTSSVDWAGGNDLTLGSGVANGAAGAVNGSPDTAATFDGSANGTAGASNTETGADTFTAEAWIKTTTTSGGKIIGFGDSQLGTSGSYDRHVYMDNSGHVVFGVYPGGIRTVATPNAYNDGQWHHVVASMSAQGMQLYVDGFLEGADQGTTSGQPYTGYWRVGGDNLNAWPYDHSSNAFAGTIDDVAIYPTALSATQIRSHYTKSGRTLNVPTAPADAYGKQVFDDNPSLYWRLNDAGSPAADSSVNRTPGVAAGGVTFGAASTVAPGTSAGFNGSDGTIGSSKSVNNPTTYSEEVWFNTTTQSGGKLVGFGDQPSGYSGNYDRHVWMENNGTLQFGTWTGNANIASSTASYNDGKWHHLVATQGSNGMALYVDGIVVGTNPQTQAQGYTGYWRFGGDTSWGGSSSFFNGQLDEAAIYPYALSATQVQAHYQASDAAVNQPPTAAFASSCTDGTCYFDASASADADGTVASYGWAFGDTKTGTGATVSHTFTASGDYDVTLTVKDNKGATTTKTQTVTVTVPAANQPPVAAFGSSCTELICAFDSSGSSDPDGTITAYAWDFGDTKTATGASPSHTYAADGTYAVKLTVTDNRGGSTSVTKNVTVKANVKPVASFTTDCTNLACGFDGTGSTDSDGTVASYAWTFGDNASATTASPNHTYLAAGTYTVTLKVTDNQGATDTATKTVTVSTANTSPTAAFTSTVSGLTASLDGTGSSDPDGTIASYAWDFGDTKTGTGSSPSHAYSAAGTYTVKLTVTDNRGGTDQVSHTVTVSAPANQSPTALFTATLSDLTVAVDAGGSSDPDGTVASYAWDFGDSKTGTGKTTTHAYSAAGTYTVKLTVTDNGGVTASTTKSVTVTAAPVSAVVAQDGFGRTGTRWGTADQGGTWTDSGTAFSTNGGKGVIAIPKAGSTQTAALGSVSVLNSLSTVEFSLDKVPTGSATYVTLSSRRVGTNESRLKARMMADGSVHLITSTVVGGTETTLKESTVAGLTYSGGDQLKIAFQVTGSGTATLTGKIWKVASAEPAAAQITSTDTSTALQTAGAFAIQGYLGSTSTSAPVTVTVDNLQVSRIN